MELVKFRVRYVKKSYKRKEYRYKRYFLGFPAKVGLRIEPFLNEDFEIEEFVVNDTEKKEIISITLSRDKTR